ncbi:methyltransferase domain protein [Ancylostoma ceylanicum]|uniref:Methyltransferase domain protein n=1 Tax=Ancylostoma ceylanicum TaxID=53326 RepID=A0A0D6LCV2_9BILA|nr:methyltransferase domain protein [Ancylostoma ceylanicum]
MIPSLWIIFTSLISTLVTALSPHPKLILISFDGFRYDLLNATMCPNIFKWAVRSSWFANGSRSQYVTYTAPNHMSIVTGLHEEDHGIVSNYFWDTDTGKFFDYFNSTKRQGVVNESLDISWYLGEPVWLTNEKSDSTRRSATFYWPNGEAPFPSPPHRPSIHRQWKDFRNLTEWMTDVDAIIDLFTNEEDPVNFVAWYVAEPDHTLHLNGFYNGELRKKIHQLDQLFGYFVAKLHDSGLEDVVNVILTADHGHAEIEGAENVMCVRDYITSEGYDLGDHMIYPHNESIALEIYRNLTDAVKKHGYKVNIFLKENIPKHLFYSNSSRIGRIVIEPEVGWAASLSCKTNKLLETYSSGNVKFNSSTHGMDPDRKEMRAFLVVGGPSIIPGKREWITFFVLIIPSICVVVLFMIYACKHTILTENQGWAWSQKGYRPLLMNTVDIERSGSSNISAPLTRADINKEESILVRNQHIRYGDYGVLGPILEKYLKTTDSILQVGCGNSQLAAEMYDNGFRTIHSIDNNSSVIEEQRLRNKQRPELVFLEDDATSMSSGDESFSVVIDKGTLDALLPPDATVQQLESVRNMFAEVDRVLKIGGRYQIITLAQQHIVKFWIEYFSKTKLDSEASISIESSLQQGPRYRFFIVDDAKAKAIRSYAVFIVPLGREGEWIFSTEKGRRTLLEQAKKDELGPFASRFDPRENGGLIDFLSCGSVDVRVTQASGESAINGKWTVEDVVVDEQEYRRLLAVLGLGGGILASFLLRHFNKAVIDAIELDPDVVKVATQWFALPSRDSRMNVQVKDALDYLEEAPQKGDREKLDMLFVDLAGAVHESGLSCPPAVFLTDPVLRNMKNSLGANGVVALNLVTRDADVAERARRSISAHFPALFHIHSEEDVNEVLLACSSVPPSFDPLKFSKSMRKDLPWLNDLAPLVGRITRVTSFRD